MFAVFNSSKEKSIIKVLLKKRKPNCWEQIFLVYRLLYSSDSMDEFRQLCIRDIVVSSFPLKGTSLCYQLDPFFLIRAIGLQTSLWSRCFNVASWLSQHLSVKKQKMKKKALEIVPDQTQLRSKSFLIRPKSARRVYDQTQLRSKLPLIRLKCARNRLWSDFSDQIDLWSDHLQTIVQNVVRSNFRPDPVISIWEHTGVHSTGPDQNSIWAWTSTWVVLQEKHFFGWKDKKFW